LDVNFRTLIAILKRAVSSGRIKENGTHTSLPMEMSDSVVMEDIVEGREGRGLGSYTYPYMPSRGYLLDQISLEGPARLDYGGRFIGTTDRTKLVMCKSKEDHAACLGQTGAQCNRPTWAAVCSPPGAQ